MRNLSLLTGILLAGLGLVTYFIQPDGSRSTTALIPLWIGIPFFLCAAVATTPARNKHAMHVAALCALIGSLPLGMAVPKLIKAAGGEELARPLAVYAQLGTGLICVVFLIAAIRSFVKARILRQAGAAN